MRKKDIYHVCIVIVIIVFIAVNINGINTFLSFQSGNNSVEFGHSLTDIPQGWNKTQDLKLTNQTKTPSGLTNGYVFIDYWDDWPEDHITSVSQAKFKAMENGNYKVLKNENITQSGIPISKQYFSNPSRDNEEVWNHIGVNYVFSKEDTNYTIQVHYFTTLDYENSTFIKEIDNRVYDDIDNIHNLEYNGFVSGVKNAYNYITGQNQH
ncbi:hypothetical protein [Methanobrevibacter sp.]|uniref:hypothetical protein n=1 Tax=Methanobrevibacter sp. TaxID=66852 RepID=UPI00388E59BB